MADHLGPLTDFHPTSVAKGSFIRALPTPLILPDSRAGVGQSRSPSAGSRAVSKWVIF